MAKRLITTVGGAYSNSYVTLEEADLIASNFPWYSDWDAYTDEQKTQALIQAAFAMQQLPWAGDKCAPASDAGKSAVDWDQYVIRGNIGGEGPFGYLNPDGVLKGIDQGDNTFRWGTENTTLLPSVKTVQLVTTNTPVTFWDKDGNVLTPDSSTSTPVNGSSITSTLTYTWDTAVGIAYFTGFYEELINPFATGTLRWGVYVNGEQLLNFPGAKAGQAQRLAWPRSGVTCDGEEADCTFIPETIKITQVIIAYNFLENPSQVPGTPSGGNSAPAGTYIKRQKIDVLEIEYDQFNSNQYNDDCDNCDDPYLIRTYPWLKDLLGCWLDASASTGNRLIRLFRN